VHSIFIDFDVYDVYRPILLQLRTELLVIVSDKNYSFFNLIKWANPLKKIVFFSVLLSANTIIAIPKCKKTST